MKKMGIVLLGMLMVLIGQALASGTEPGPGGVNPVSPQAREKAKVIWTGQSSSFAIRWTTAEIQARPLKKTDHIILSATSLAQKGFENFRVHLDGDEKRVLYERSLKIISVVGSIVSLRDELYYNIQPSAHPGLETRFTAIDLAKPGEVPDPWAEEEGFKLGKMGKVAKLTDYFPEKDVLKALLNDTIIKEVLGGQSPKSLKELSGLLKDQRIDIKEIPYIFPQDFLTRFAFYQLQGDRVAVRLGLPSAGGAARGLHAELGLLLPIPDALKKPLHLAASGKAGFLLKDQGKIAGKGVTRISFDLDEKGRVK